MIKELAQFVKYVSNTVKDRALEPKVGLHILIRFDEEGNGRVVGSERYLGKKHEGISKFLKDCAIRQEAAWMIDTNKCFDLPMKGLHSASPYCVAFKRESWIGGEKYPTESGKPNILERLPAYFAKAFDIKFCLNEEEQLSTLQFQNFLKAQMPSLLDALPDYITLDWSDYILIYKEEPIERYQAFQEIYLSDGIFNTADYTIAVRGEILGTSNFHNGFNSKKPFLAHQTASFDITSRIGASDAKALAEFQVYAGKKLFPNPIPIFIDKPELSKDTIELFHRSEDNKLSHRDIISELWKRTEDLGNYYLLYFSGGAIRDFDYVAKFRYLLIDEKDEDGNHRPWVIDNITEIKEKDKTVQPSIKLNTVFDFERVAVRELFNNALIKIDDKKDTVTMKYFDDMDPKYYRAALYTLLLKYRKPVYDFIYKSMRSSLGGKQFENICMTGITDNLKENKEYSIKSKLNIYFSLYQYFDKTNNNYIMPSKIEVHKAEIAQVVDEANTHFTTDEAYAFGAGQLIYFLLSKSEAGERTHAVLEPFLQKTSHSHFNDALANILLKYKHAILFDYKRFNVLAGEVLDYIPEKGLQELRPFLLAGYFCPNIFYTKKSDLPS
jgi:CRISPR-associated protein Csh1